MQAALNGLPALTAREQALAKIRAINLSVYARTRNQLDGRVTRLSPYITHGITDVPEVIHLISEKNVLSWDEKFIFELGWREYFHHVWDRLGEDIWCNQTPPPASHYADEMPHDILTATTGVAIIDDQIRALYQTGYVHNHARMWLASYIVHVRKIDWRIGARWMMGYLLDGDMASNTLSWQWVAGTWTGKPYLFNAENVEKYAPHMDCAESVIDVSYEVMDNIARGDKPHLMSPQSRKGLVQTQPPVLLDAEAAKTIAVSLGFTVLGSLPSHAMTLCHPWAINATYADDSPITGFIVNDFHDAQLWSEARWRFVLGAMREITDMILFCRENVSIPERAPHRVVSTLNPHYDVAIKQLARNGATVISSPRAFINPEKCQRSFSSFWHKAKKETFPI